MAKKYTILQFADRMERLAKNLNKAILPPFREGMKVMQRALYAEYWTSPFGARIWKWARRKFAVKSGPAVKLGSGTRRRYARWSASEGAYKGQINVEGMAAKMELGGRLRKHVFWGRESDVRDPGIPVPRKRVYERVIEQKLFPRMVDDVSRSFWNFVEREL